MVLGRAAWTAARASVRRAAGVVAAAVAWLMSPGWSGWRRIRGRWPSRMPRAGSRKIVPAVLAWLNKERRAVRVCRRRLPDRGSVAVMTSPAGDFAQVHVAPGPVQQQ